MPAIAKIRFVNVIYENRQKRYNDELFVFDGHNSAVLLENGGGKTVFVQTLLQAVIPHITVANRKAKETFSLAQSPAHIAIEWILQESPRVYGVTAVTLFLRKDELQSYKYAYRYMGGDKETIEHLPFTAVDINGRKRSATAEEMHDYYLKMSQKSVNAHVFEHITEYNRFLETEFKIIEEEWRSLAVINTGEGDVAKFFEACRSTNDLVNKLLIPAVLLAVQSDSQASFTKMFEEKRTHFKRYNELKQQIEENRLIERELSKVMEVYAERHVALSTHNSLKQQAKAYYQNVVNQSDTLQAEFTEAIQKGDKLQIDKETLSQEKASLTIAKLQSKESAANREFLAVHQEALQAEENLSRLRQEKDKLCYLRDRAKRDEKAAQINETQVLLAAQLENQEIACYETELSAVNRQLKSIYNEQEAELNHQLEAFSSQLSTAKEEAKKLQEQRDEQQKDWQELMRSEQSYVTKIEFLQEEQGRIAQAILANCQEQNVVDELVQWKKAAEYVQTDLAKQIKRENAQEAAKIQKSQELEKIVQVIQTAQLVQENRRGKLQNFVEAEIELVQKFTAVPYLSFVRSIYLDQGKIEAGLEIQRVRCEKELEIAREEERRDFRLTDSYGSQAEFIFDDALASFLKTANLVVESGSAYLERMVRLGVDDVEKQLARFPLWPFCLITTKADQAELVRRVQGINAKLTAPVLILSDIEAKLIADGSLAWQTVCPDFWPKTCDKGSFEEWKQVIFDLAEHSKTERITKEQALSRVERLNLELDSFERQYPFREYQTLKEELEQEEVVIEAARRNRAKLREDIKEAEHAVRVCQRTIRDLEGQASSFAGKITAGLDWLAKEKVKLETATRLAECRARLALSHKEIEKLAAYQTELAKTETRVREKQGEWQQRLFQLTGEELYRDLADYLPEKAQASEAVLKTKRKHIQLLLRNVSIEHELLVNRIQEYQREYQQFAERLAEYQVDRLEGEVFPADGDVKIRTMLEDISRTQPMVSTQQGQSQAKHNAWQKIMVKCQDAIEYYHEKFPHAELHEFTEELSMVENRLMGAEEKVLREIAIQVTRQQGLSSQLDKWKKLAQEMQVYNGKLEFLQEVISPAVLTEDEKTAFPYQGWQMVGELLKIMQASLEKLQSLNEAATAVKEGFELFCNSASIRNEKMRQNALSGIRRKQSFAEMEEWAKNIRYNITAINNLAEQHMQDFNNDINFFVNHLHVHLVTIRDEIAAIGRMTAVKVEEQVKTIYEIKTPIWEETEAKVKIMAHLEWMSVKLSSAEYKAEDGLEDSKKIRRDIEQWLRPSYLFRVISPGKGFSVGVRKVSNDNRISNYPVDWAASNSWSGGEKWSKNMALFLGIQSYIAEKLQPTQHRQGNIRTVVLDNPFGQASSDHVLEPVFFIAQKLGYQVIALTALAEGKFLRDYFPIIYSCRLRQATGSGAEIMDKELQINHAYFADKAPQTLNRLGRLQPTEQLSLAWEQS